MTSWIYGLFAIYYNKKNQAVTKELEIVYKFTLKKKDTNLMDFHIEWDELMSIKCNVTWIVNNLAIMPYNLRENVHLNSAIKKWINSRFIPRNRKFVESVINTVMTSNEPRELSLLKITLALSLNDDYWVVPYGSSHKWSNQNLYDNSFNKTLSLVAFTGHGSKVKGLTSSPEFTTNGALRKCWRRINNKIYLYKAMLEMEPVIGREPYSEYFAYQVAKTMGINAVEYDLSEWKGIVCSTCELFTSADISYVPAAYVYGDTNVTDILKQANKKLYNKLVDMMVFDAIILNEDRHFNNFGFLRDNKTGELIDLAPIFDNGMSLLALSGDNVIKDINSAISGKVMTFAFIDADRLDLVKQYLTDSHRNKIMKLINFEFKKHPKYNLSDNRIKILEQLVRDRANQLTNTVNERLGDALG